MTIYFLAIHKLILIFRDFKLQKWKQPNNKATAFFIIGHQILLIVRVVDEYFVNPYLNKQGSLS